MNRLSILSLWLLAAGCAPPTIGLAIPDTTEVLGQLRREHPGVELAIEGIETKRVTWWHSTSRPDSVASTYGQTTIFDVQGPDSAVVLVYYAAEGSALRRAYSSGLLEPFDGCGALDLSIEGIGALRFKGRDILVVNERRVRRNDCIDGEFADTVTAHLLDVTRGFAEVLRLDTEVSRKTVRSIPCEAQCWDTDTLAIRRLLWNGEDGPGLSFDVVGVGTGEREAILRFVWNADTTAIVKQP